MKKIALVCGHFMPEIGYQEVYLAKAFVKLGHEVTIFTSTKVSPSSKSIIKKDYQPGVTRTKGYVIKRLMPSFSKNSFVYVKHLHEEIKKIDPDIVLVIGVGKLFPSPIFLNKQRAYKLVTLFGDNSDFFDKKNLTDKIKKIIKTKLLNFMLKKNLYIKAIQGSDRIVFYTNETEGIITSYVPKRFHPIIDHKKMQSTLGFDASEFYYDIEKRKNIRKQYAIDDDEVVLITSTRLKKEKKIEKVINAVTSLHKKGIKVRYIMIGSMNDEYADELKSYIHMQTYPEIFTLLPFMSHEMICSYYNAADIGIWLRAAISIQEAMGTGLPIVLENKASVNHLVKDGINGFYYEHIDELTDKLEESVLKLFENRKNGINDRAEIAKMNYENLSYEFIAKQIIKNL